MCIRDRAITDIISPNIINVFPTYRLQSPAVINGSAAILFGKKGLISFDYTIKDYAGLKFNQGENSDFTAQNNIISNSLKSTSSYKIGGEYRINKALSLRGGYRFEESPYEEGNIISDLDGYSIGMGYNFGKIKLDATFDQFKQTRNQQLFSEGLTDSNRINAKNSNITISLSFSL